MIAKLPPVVAGILFLTGATVVTGGVMTYQAGTIRVSVGEKRPNGDHVHVIVPAILVPAAMQMVPARKLGRHAKEIRQWLPAIQAATQGLEKAPDTVLVEVIDSHEHVTVSKRGGALHVDVVDEHEDVHVTVPLGTIRSVAEHLAAGEPVDENLPNGPPV
jgi:hypothetical protein